MSQSYIEKLRDPRWQRKRLEVLQRDDWKCRFCGDASSTLAVHHKWYIPEREPWEYPDGVLITLCEECHGKETKDRPGTEEQLLAAVQDANFSVFEIEWLTDIIINAKWPKDRYFFLAELEGTICHVGPRDEFLRWSHEELLKRHPELREGA